MSQDTAFVNAHEVGQDGVCVWCRRAVDQPDMGCDLKRRILELEGRSSDLARAWLARQKATAKDDMLDEGDCRCCGRPAGMGHEPTDPCGIIAALLGEPS